MSDELQNEPHPPPGTDPAKYEYFPWISCSAEEFLEYWLPRFECAELTAPTERQLWCWKTSQTDRVRALLRSNPERTFTQAALQEEAKIEFKRIKEIVNKLSLKGEVDVYRGENGRAVYIKWAGVTDG